MQLERSARVAYANAVEAAVLSSQNAWLRGGAEKPIAPANAASGTYHNTGEAIHRAILGQQRAALAACPSRERRKRTQNQWLEMYDQAMLDKREREKQARFATYLKQGKEAA